MSVALLSRGGAVLSPVAVRVLNRLLAHDREAMSLLRAHAGQTVVFTLPPVEISLAVSADGELRTADPTTHPDLHIHLSPASVTRVLSGNAAAAEIASIEGDAAFAATIRQLAGRLHWDVEESLSRVVGDIAAHRIAMTARDIDAWRREAAGRVLQGAAEYVTEETRVLPPRAEVDAWFQEVDRIRDTVERLDKRLALVEARGRVGRP